MGIENSLTKCFIDSGAGGSVIKVNSIRDGVNIWTDSTLEVCGISQNTHEVKTIGYVKADILLNNMIIHHTFHVVRDKDVNMDQDAILGIDFLEGNDIKIEFGQNPTISFRNNQNSREIITSRNSPELVLTKNKFLRIEDSDSNSTMERDDYSSDSELDEDTMDIMNNINERSIEFFDSKNLNKIKISPFDASTKETNYNEDRKDNINIAKAKDNMKPKCKINVNNTIKENKIEEDKEYNDKNSQNQDIKIEIMRVDSISKPLTEKRITKQDTTHEQRELMKENKKRLTTKMNKGLNNPSNYCYANALFQALFFDVIPIRSDHSHTSQKQHCIQCLLYKTQKMLRNVKSSVNPVQFHKWVKNQPLNEVIRDSPQDVHELLKSMIPIHTIQNNKEIPKGFLNELYGIMKWELKCDTCEHTKNKKQIFNDLSLNLTTTIEESLLNFFQSKLIIDLRCSECENINTTFHTPMILKLPQILCLHIKRYTSQGSKSNIPMQFKYNIIMDPFMDPLVDPDMKRSTNFELQSIINHIGQETNTGHYTTIRVLNEKQGILYNDNIVTKIDVSSLESENAYLVFYKYEPESEKLTINKYQTIDPCYVDNRYGQIINEIKLDHLEKEDALDIQKLLYEYNDIFHLEGDKLTACPIFKHDIVLHTDTPIINIKNYRLPFAQREEIKRQVDLLLEQEIIEHSISPYNSPLLLVPKQGVDKDGKPKQRLVVDFRRINECSLNQTHPVPVIQDILDQLGNSKVFSKIDLNSSYHQLLLTENAKPLTAFSTPHGHYNFLRMPFGLKNAAHSFTLSMNAVMRNLIGKCLFVYMDDLIIFGESIKEHLIHLQTVLQRLREWNLKVAPEKCDLGKSQILFLGHIISADGVTPNPIKVVSISNFPRPHTQRGVRSFLGMVNYYRRFINNYAHLAKPLYRLLEKEAKFKWNDECEEAFVYFRTCLICPPILQYPNFTQTFNLTCDASKIAVSGILSQGPPGSDLPIAFASKTLIGPETRYPSVHLELFAIIYAIREFHCYIYSNHFKVFTDHKALQWLFQVKSPNSRLLRWKMELACYDFEIIHIKGKTNVVADCLSRYIHQENENKIDFEDEPMPKIEPLRINNIVMTRAKTKKLDKNTEITEISPKMNLNPRVLLKPLSHEELPLFIESNDENLTTDYKTKAFILSLDDLKPVKHMKLDKTNLQVGEVIYDEQNKQFFLINRKNVDSQINFYVLQNNLKILKELLINNKINKITMYKNDFINSTKEYPKFKELLHEIFGEFSFRFLLITRVITTLILEDEIQQVLQDFHNSPLSGHQGVNRMIGRISNQFKWIGLSRDVKEFIRKCPKCQVTKASNNKKQPLAVTTTSTVPFFRVSLDIVGPLPTSYNNFKYLLTFQDDLTKFFGAIPLENHEADTVARHFVNDIILRYQMPECILTDQGSEFLSDLFSKVLKLLGIKRRRTSGYSPWSNGSLERQHRDLKAMLRAYIEKDQSNWPDFIQYIVFVINTTKNRSTGYTPHQLLYGFQPIVPSNLKRKPEPVYTYDDFANELRYKLQKAHEIARENLVESKLNNKLYYDKKAKLDKYEVGDLILIRNNAPKTKLDDLFLGPYEITKVMSDTNVQIKVKKKLKVVHKNHIKKFYD